MPKKIAPTSQAKPSDFIAIFLIPPKQPEVPKKWMQNLGGCVIQ
jgi:hypothetical protein